MLLLIDTFRACNALINVELFSVSIAVFITAILKIVLLRPFGGSNIDRMTFRFLGLITLIITDHLFHTRMHPMSGA